MTPLTVAPLAETDLVRLAEPAGGALDALAAGANLRRLDEARRRLHETWAGLPDLVSQPPAVLAPVAAPALVIVDEVWDVVDHILRHDDARAGRISLGLDAAPTVDDQLLFDTSYEVHRPHLGPLAAKLAGHASIVLRAVGRHLPALEHLSADLETLVGRPVEADAVIFGPGSLHVDPAERGGHVLFVALDGTLTATPGSDTALGEPDSGTERGESRPPTEPLDVGSGEPLHLTPGRGVFAAAGTALRVTAGTTGLALRVRIPVVSTAQLRAQTSATARYHPLLRADLPTDLDGPVESYAGSLYDQPLAFHREVSGALAGPAQALAAARLRAWVPARVQASLLDARAVVHDTDLTVSGGTRLRCPLTAGLCLTDRPDGPALVAQGLVVELHPDLAERLVPHLDGRPFDPAPLLHDLAHLDELAELADPASPAGDRPGDGHAETRAHAAHRRRPPRPAQPRPHGRGREPARP